jgi:hypothetical protein
MVLYVLARVRALVSLVMILIYGEPIMTNMFIFIYIIPGASSVVKAYGIGIDIQAKPNTNRSEEALIR